MPRSRAVEMPQRQQSPRGTLHVRTSSSDSDPLNNRPKTDRSPKLGTGRLVRGAYSDPVNKKKLGTRISDLESQLGQAQEELKSLKNQLTSAEAAKKAAQEQLAKKSNKPKMVLKPVVMTGKQSSPNESQREKQVVEEKSNENLQEIDVFEVPEKVQVERNAELIQSTDQDELKCKDVNKHTDAPMMVELEKPESLNEMASKNEELNLLKAKLEEKEKELVAFGRENESLKGQLDEKSLEISKSRSKEEETATKLKQVQLDLEKCNTNAAELNEKLEVTEKAKEALETELKKLGVQTEQWKKAADAAAAVLAGAAEMNDRRLSERCGSMDKYYGGNVFQQVGHYGSYLDSPDLDDPVNDFRGGRRKGSGIKMFGDLWKKKGQK